MRWPWSKPEPEPEPPLRWEPVKARPRPDNCPKCGSDKPFTIRHVPQRRAGVYQLPTHYDRLLYGVTGQWYQEVGYPEHMQVTCADCGGSWNEAPLDSAPTQETVIYHPDDPAGKGAA